MVSRLRTCLFWLHLAVGLVAGLFILNMAFSGALIAYERPLTAWIERSQRTVAVPPGGERLGIEALAARVQAARPGLALKGVTRYADPASSVMFNVGAENGVLFVNPYSGDLLGEGSEAMRNFFHAVTGWHRWLSQEGPAREVGKAFTGAAAIAYFVLLLTGLCIWLPRTWSRNNLRRITLFKRGLQGKARDWNWHNVIGIWCAPVLLFVTLTGIIMSYQWANNLLFQLTGSPPPEQRREGGGGRPGGGGGRPGGGGRGEQAGAANLGGYDALLTQAEQKVTGWKSVSVRFAPSPKAPVTFTIDRGDGGRPDLRDQITFNRQTGAVQRWQPYTANSAGQKLRFWARFVHTGEAGGWLGETIAVVASAGGILLVWTGFSLAWRRFFGKRKSGAATEPEASPATAPTPL